MSLAEAAQRSGLSERTIRRHCMAGNAWAWKTLGGDGDWRVVLDAMDLPADPPGHTRPVCAMRALPEGYWVTWLEAAADTMQVSQRALRKSCGRGRVWAWRLFSGNGPWRVVMTALDEAAYPPGPTVVPTGEERAA